MKFYLIASVMLIGFLSSCTKENSTSLKEQYTYEVYAVDFDSSKSKVGEIQGRDNPYIKVAAFILNSGVVVYIQNLQKCQADIEFEYESFEVTGIKPNPKNNFNHNQLRADQVDTFAITGRLKDKGKIRIKNLTICDWRGPSTWVEIDLTTISALPVRKVEVFLNSTHLYWFVTGENNVAQYLVYRDSELWKSVKATGSNHYSVKL